jgi:outer membrane protein, heavy metal efflux system
MMRSISPTGSRTGSRMRAVRLAGLFVALAATGCVSQTAGLDVASGNVRARGEGELRWQSHDDDFDVEKLRREVLAEPLTADAAARLAVLSHPEVQASLDRIGVARGALVSALRLPNPEVELAAKSHGGRTSYDIAFMIDLTRFFLLPLTQAAASLELDAVALEAAGKALDVAFEARMAFYEVQAARQILELRKTVAYATSQSWGLAQKLREAGNTIELDALNERALYEESRIAVARAEAEELVARERLNAALGLHGSDAVSWTIEQRLEDPPASEPSSDELERRALERSLDLQLVRTRHAAAARRGDAARATAWVPHVEAGIHAERSAAEGWGLGPEVGVGLPLFYQGQGEIGAADAEMLVQQRTNDAVATRVRATARQLTTRLRLVRERAAFYEATLLPLRSRILDETQLQYNAMSIGVFQLLAAKRDQIEVARAYVETLREYWQVRAELEQLARGRLPASAAAEAPQGTEPCAVRAFRACSSPFATLRRGRELAPFAWSPDGEWAHEPRRVRESTQQHHAGRFVGSSPFPEGRFGATSSACARELRWPLLVCFPPSSLPSSSLGPCSASSAANRTAAKPSPSPRRTRRTPLVRRWRRRERRASRSPCSAPRVKAGSCACPGRSNARVTRCSPPRSADSSSR